MGFITSKKITLNEDFEYNVLSDANLQMSICSKDTLPTQESDILLKKNQNVAISFDYVLHRLLQNDEFLNQYAEKIDSHLKSVTKTRLANAFKYTGTYPPSNKTGSLDTFEKYADQHLSSFHSDSCEVQLDYIHENYMNSDCSNFDESGAKQNFQKTSVHDDNTHIQNDIVTKVEFDDSPGITRPYNYIQVLVMNRMTKYRFVSTFVNPDIDVQLPSTQKTKYIYKEWLSGFKELYLYIPSTCTFYNENPDEDGIKENCTYILVQINKQHFPLNHIYHIDISGQSFPLQIHYTSEKDYADVVMPSIVRTLCMSKTTDSNVGCIYDMNTNKYMLYFCCYGTDAQAIRIYAD